MMYTRLVDLKGANTVWNMNAVYGVLSGDAINTTYISVCIIRSVLVQCTRVNTFIRISSSTGGTAIPHRTEARVNVPGGGNTTSIVYNLFGVR